MDIRRTVYTVSLAAVLAVAPLVVTAAGQTPPTLPVAQMETILGARGDVSHGVLGVDADRPDLRVRGGTEQVPFAAGFGIHHDLYFAPLSGDRAVFNGDIAVLPGEIQPAIDAILRHGLDFQGEHQHLYDLRPMVWFLHFRGTGTPLGLARAVRAVLDRTGTPLPQQPPAHQTTPLPAAELGHILHGDASVGENGVVTVVVPRTDRIVLGGVRIPAELNVSTNVEFEPLAGGRAAALPDFSMTSPEVRPVIATLRHAGWEIGCLYNQETDEQPQLYFSHAFATGDPVTLAHRIRAAVAHTAVP
jgi:hypothetical protein